MPSASAIRHVSAVARDVEHAHRIPLAGRDTPDRRQSPTVQEGPKRTIRQQGRATQDDNLQLAARNEAGDAAQAAIVRFDRVSARPSASQGNELAGSLSRLPVAFDEVPVGAEEPNRLCTSCRDGHGSVRQQERSRDSVELLHRIARQHPDGQISARVDRQRSPHRDRGERGVPQVSTAGDRCRRPEARDRQKARAAPAEVVHGTKLVTTDAIRDPPWG
jgi:hypothetical protein